MIRSLARLVKPLGCTLSRSAPARSYYPVRSLMERKEGPILANPYSVTDRLVKLIALHDNVKDPSAIKLGCTFSEIGINDLDLVEVMIMCEEEFGMEFTEEEGESVHTVEDLARILSANFHTDA